MNRTFGTEKIGSAYEFNTSELGIVILGFKREVSRLKKQADQWRNHPKNEGQVTYTERIGIINGVIKMHQKTIYQLTEDREKILAYQKSRS